MPLHPVSIAIAEALTQSPFAKRLIDDIRRTSVAMKAADGAIKKVDGLLAKDTLTAEEFEEILKVLPGWMETLRKSYVQSVIAGS